MNAAAARILPSSSRYRLASQIASGGMGSVYIGIQRGAAGFRRPVAIKRAHPYLLEDPDFRETILREARDASVVRHPNVVSVDDVEEANGELLLVMDYVEGTSLSQILASKRPIDPAVAVRMIVDVCAGLDAIHSATSEDGTFLGLVHRDVCPQNILVGTDGVARITDFGVAKANRESARNGAASRRGKFGYMAPEVLRDGSASPQSDIFALGVVLWEAITGRELFKGDTLLDSIRLVHGGKVPLASSINASVPKTLDRLLEQCLASDPEERIACTRELYVALEAIFPAFGRRDAVMKLVNGAAGPMIERQRRVIDSASVSVRPSDQDPGAGSGEYAIAHRSLRSALAVREDDAVVVDSFVPREADLFLTAGDAKDDDVPCTLAFDTVRMDAPAGFEQEPEPPPAANRAASRYSRTRIALGIAIVALLVGVTAIAVDVCFARGAARPSAVR